MRFGSTVLLLSAALALAALVPATAAADTCPPGQEGMPPYCKPIAPTLKVKVLRATPGAIKLWVKVNLPGQVKVTGKGVRTKLVSVGAGARKIVIKLTRQAKKKLQEKGRLKLKLKVVFSPSNGAPSVRKFVKVTIKKHTRR